MFRDQTRTEPSEPPETRVGPSIWSWPTREVWPWRMAWQDLVREKEGLVRGGDERGEEGVERDLPVNRIPYSHASI